MKFFKTEKGKLTLILIAVLLVLALVVGGIFVFAGKDKKKDTADEDNNSSSQILIDGIDADKDNSDSGVPAPDTESKTDYKEMVEDIKADTPQKSEGEKAQPSAKPITQAPVKGDTGGVTIGGSTEQKKYSCGTPNHKCEAPETHAFVLNLELEGCKYCGSHSCPSFYGTDEWGNGGLYPKLCSKYDIKKDPAQYCQSCKKKCGDGTGATCVRFVDACACPICKEPVASRVCHTCK